jgi:hypothetical protein
MATELLNSRMTYRNTNRVMMVLFFMMKIALLSLLKC